MSRLTRLTDPNEPVVINPTLDYPSIQSHPYEVLSAFVVHYSDKEGSYISREMLLSTVYLIAKSREEICHA